MMNCQAHELRLVVLMRYSYSHTNYPDIIDIILAIAIHILSGYYRYNPSYSYSHTNYPDITDSSGELLNNG